MLLHIQVSCSSHSGWVVTVLSAQQWGLVHSSALAALCLGRSGKPISPPQLGVTASCVCVSCSPASAAATYPGGRAQVPRLPSDTPWQSDGLRSDCGRQLIWCAWGRGNTTILYVCSSTKMFLNFAPGHPPPRTKNEIWEQVSQEFENNLSGNMMNTSGFIYST